MKPFVTVLAVLFILQAAGWARSSDLTKPAAKPLPRKQPATIVPATIVPATIVIDAATNGSTDASVTVGAGPVTVLAGAPDLQSHKTSPPGGIRPGNDTDLYLDPAEAPAPGMAPAFGTVITPRMYNPVGAVGTGDLPNAMRFFFNSTSGGFGFRVSYDRRLSTHTRMIAGAEFLTFGPARALALLGPKLPAGTARISLVSLPFGLQRQIGAEHRIVPHAGFAGGPILRMDHHELPYAYPTYGAAGGYGGAIYGGTRFSLALPLDELPTLSLTVGGYVDAGVDVRMGGDRSYALTVDARYAVVRFPDALGNPGDFGGLGFTVGFGKYF